MKKHNCGRSRSVNGEGRNDDHQTNKTQIVDKKQMVTSQSMMIMATRSLWSQSKLIFYLPLKDNISNLKWYLNLLKHLRRRLKGHKIQFKLCEWNWRKKMRRNNFWALKSLHFATKHLWKVLQLRTLNDKSWVKVRKWVLQIKSASRVVCSTRCRQKESTNQEVDLKLLSTQKACCTNIS